jgi:hypothetical protein
MDVPDEPFPSYVFYTLIDNSRLYLSLFWDRSKAAEYYLLPALCLKKQVRCWRNRNGTWGTLYIHFLNYGVNISWCSA